jgi:hypothetical protein
MTHTAQATQLELWGERARLQTQLAAIKEFERWSASLDQPRSIAPALGPDDQDAVAFAVAFHDVVADFEDGEGPLLRRELKRVLTNDVLTESMVSLRLLQRVIDECKHRSVHPPRGVLAMKAAVAEQFHSLRSMRRRKDEARAS